MAPAGYVGLDRFSYRLDGIFGGSSTTQVRIVVAPDPSAQATVVSLTRDHDGGASACLLGNPDSDYRVEQATEFGNWAYLQTLRTDAEGKVRFRYMPGQEAQRYFRFRKNG